ncbi:hypothetical protein WJ32_04640 [Burkholderia ubonensis]|uniref:NAD-dependent epimerase/dehydratase domain-containing protein n=1 Tax=Burkholderia ubonensis TaxID=101571 RepID=A0A103RU58_9BURK|nr:NAD-dependent epimerase/dehydratase family protein [Burkholderia ubonensis]AOJ61821.1 hypothetical protein WJ32_04640 [Burkholderia ubonensis]KVG73947.1 hypothetical protein WJ33_01885 [Burkholderia ubonensis]
MRVLVIGSGGFIGSHVADTLEATCDVVRADILPSNAKGFVCYDKDNPDYAHMLRSIAPDVCINCSGAASVPASLSDPQHDYLLNTRRVIEILEAIRVNSPGTRFVHLSSAAVYGNPAVMPVTEAAPAAPVSPYGWHKYYAELACREYFEQFGVRSVSLRIFSAYGPGLRKQLFWDVYGRARGQEVLELFGTGGETRDFIFIDDLVSCIALILQSDVFDGRAVNVASGVSVPIERAVATLLAHLDWHLKLAFSGSARQGDPMQWQADISSLTKLGFEPKYDIVSGLRKVAVWLKEQN